MIANSTTSSSDKRSDKEYLGKDFNIVTVGDCDSGKTELIIAYTKTSSEYDGEYEYTPPFVDNKSAVVDFCGCPVKVGIFDTSGEEEFENIRLMAYKEARVFLAVFSLIKRTSLENIEKKWIPEMRKTAPNVPIVLVGTNLDVRSQRKNDESDISREEGDEVAKSLGAIYFIECSTKTKEGVEEVFKRAVRCVLNPKPKMLPKSKKSSDMKKCIIM